MKIHSLFLASFAFFGVFACFAFFCSRFCLRAALSLLSFALLLQLLRCLREVCLVRAICLENEMRNDEWVLLEKITLLKLPFAYDFKQGGGIMLIESRSIYIVETINGRLPHTTSFLRSNSGNKD